MQIIVRYIEKSKKKSHGWSVALLSGNKDYRLASLVNVSVCKKLWNVL